MPKKYLRAPELIVGFDTETTGLSVASDRAISYGFCEYRFGRLVRSERFYVIPDRPITEGARRVHGLTLGDLEAKRAGADVLTIEAGLTRAVQFLRDYHRRGAYVVGANVVSFDLEMLRRSALSVLGDPLQGVEFDISLLRIIDVVEHDVTIEPRNDLRPRRGLANLCDYYGIAPGCHDALGDAVAAVEVFLEQVVRNNAGQMALDLAVSESVIEDPIAQV